ncbi:pyruvate formate lyase activating enzyme [Desulfatibacillum alkenivorans DSM 16219]|jgi:pyruvate formate lyase activating enzyme|uniref:Pyruvate formate lyase activating enzyme n=1 Tax=Desulfatibacillum alkenivorans DSM 16219 TaxID=1121393 RepID=A0A1M6M9G3_9BACT|nr:glycyl-radical enzyme activating protein [Desulfatibacillum alkenivorans]SHJ80091.1 pyruvate formate lyase activating enzyme [Desulfatibacillum alkenivorans DSM 16219]
MAETCLITEIQRFAVNDGPGIRTNVFLKGCPLKCAWCHNPETISAKPQVFWKKRLCVQCGACMDACPTGAVQPPIDPVLSRAEGSDYYKIDLARCDGCLNCVDACPYGALEITGQAMTVEEILDEVESDRPFYENSGGGVTLSGGEPTAHPEFAGKILAGAKARGLHTCLDTNGHCSWSVLESLLKHTDVVLFDLKHTDPEKHKEWTGVDNALIKENLALLVKNRVETWVRIPVIPGFNDAIQDHKAAALFLSELPGRIARVDLLPYHNWCQDKYGWLGRSWSLWQTEAMEPSLLEIPRELYEMSGLEATIGGSGFEGA